MSTKKIDKKQTVKGKAKKPVKKPVKTPSKRPVKKAKPMEDGGVLPFIAEDRRQYKDLEKRKTAGADIRVRPVEGDFVVDSPYLYDHPYLAPGPKELSPEAKERLKQLADKLLASGKDHLDVNGPPVLCEDCDKCEKREDEG